MEHFAIGGTKAVIGQLIISYSTLLSSFVIPEIAGVNATDWIIKILQIAALIFSIRASRNALKKRDELDKAGKS
jgi:hypothetical protein